MRRRRRGRKRRENNKIVEKGIITLRREIMKLRESIKVVVDGNKKHLGRKIIKNCGGGNKNIEEGK